MPKKMLHVPIRINEPNQDTSVERLLLTIRSGDYDCELVANPADQSLKLRFAEGTEVKIMITDIFNSVADVMLGHDIRAKSHHFLAVVREEGAIYDIRSETSLSS